MRLSTGVKSDLQHHMFAAISIDNIGILQPFSFVSSLDETRSWHGTSVQCVQPLPISGHLTSNDLLSPRTTENRSSKHIWSSPVNPPIPRERRKRTLTEHASPHSTMVIPNQEPAISNSNLLPAFHPREYWTTTSTLHLKDFRPNTIEQSALNTLQTDLFHCILLQKFGSGESSPIFPGLQSFINCVRRQSTDREVTYVEILKSERADSKPTLLSAVGRLQQVLVQELQQKYVLVVGDAKTTSHGLSAMSTRPTYDGFYLFLEIGMYSIITKRI